MDEADEVARLELELLYGESGLGVQRALKAHLRRLLNHGCKSHLPDPMMIAGVPGYASRVIIQDGLTLRLELCESRRLAAI